MSAPVALNILVPPTATLPSDLEMRLKATPTRSPTELAEALEKHAARTQALRTAHLKSIQDLAAREAERCANAAARKLRMAASSLERVQRKLEWAETKTTAKKEAAEAKRAEMKAKRDEMARNVAAARVAATALRERRAAELLDAEKLAFVKHSKAVQAVHDKSKWQVQHAIAVAAAQKEKLAEKTAAAGAKLTERLQTAETRRGAAQSGVSPSSSRVFSRVLNEQKVRDGMKAIMYKEAMEKATSRREAHLQSVKEKANGMNERAANVVAAVHAKADGTDAATAASKAKLYEKMISAEVSRLCTLKKRGERFGERGDTISAIVVRLDKDFKQPRAALVKRLTNVPRTLLTTAKARHAGAKSRRTLLSAQMTIKMANANAKRAAALARVGKKRAGLVAAVLSKEQRSLMYKAMHDGAALATLACEKARIHAAAKSREAAHAKRVESGESNSTKCSSAAERHAAKLRAIAKKGVCALRSGAAQSRRDSATASVVAKGEKNAARCAAAAATKERLIAERIERARRSTVMRGTKTTEAKEEVASSEC